jgi:hypothetical protein
MNRLPVFINNLLFCALLLSQFLVACRKDKEARTKGTISGTVSPSGKAIAVQALDQQHFVYDAVFDASGAFKFSALPAGTYTVYVVPSSGFAATAGTTITVTAGHDVNTGTLLLYPSSGPTSLNYLSYDVNGTPGA